MLALTLLAHLISGASAADTHGPDIIERRLRTGYPDFVSGVSNGQVVFKDGSELPLDDGKADKSFDDWIDAPDIEDMFRLPYAADGPPAPPPKDFDPGRARNEAFFRKIYGDCTAQNFGAELADVVWLPKKSGRKLKVAALNGVARRLQAVSDELDLLPSSFDRYLIPAAGTFNCRTIAGSANRSAHAYGIAFDIAIKHAHYWQWSAPKDAAAVAYKNEIPLEIVRVFEKHGFIWGGRWYHYDTMHFEYRPELLPPRAPLP